MKPIYLIVASLFLLTSCTEEPEMTSYYFLKRQLTPDKQHYIYWYQRPGPMAFSSDYYGLQIMGLDEPFKDGEGLDLDGDIDYWISMDTLVISSNSREDYHPKDTLPVNITYEKLDNIVVKHIQNHPGTGGGLNRFKFDSLSVSANRITFYNVDGLENGNKTYSYPLGAISVEANGNTITKIEFSHHYKSMTFTRIDEKGKTLTGEPENGSDSYEFIPTKEIAVSRLGEVGIFFNFKPNSKY